MFLQILFIPRNLKILLRVEIVLALPHCSYCLASIKKIYGMAITAKTDVSVFKTCKFNVISEIIGQLKFESEKKKSKEKDKNS